MPVLWKPAKESASAIEAITFADRIAALRGSLLSLDDLMLLLHCVGPRINLIT